MLRLSGGYRKTDWMVWRHSLCCGDAVWGVWEGCLDSVGKLSGVSWEAV